MFKRKRQSCVEPKHEKKLKTNGKRFPCQECDYKCKTNTLLKRHLWCVHDLGNGKWFSCQECDYKSKINGHLKRHLWQVHDLGNGKWFSCQECDYKCKRNGDLKQHLSYVHDIGLFECGMCLRNRNSQNEYVTKQGETTIICRTCYHKATGKKSRVEKVWSDYLDEHVGTNFLLGSDRSLRGLGGCSLKRPDKIYASVGVVEIDECDEHQHRGDNGSYKCDEARLSELYDDPSIVGKKLVVIRWNPHSYNVPPGKVKQNFEERLSLMVQLKLWLRKNPPSSIISVFYICYDLDHIRLVQNYSRYMIYDSEDVKKLEGAN